MKAKYSLLNIDGFTYQIEGNTWNSVDFAKWSPDNASIFSSVIVLSDFGVNAEFTQVYGDRSYSKFLLEKEMRESGIAIGNMEVLIHQNIKIDKLNSGLLFSLISSSELSYTRDKVDHWGGGSFLFSLYSLYATAIERYKNKEPSAFIFVLPGSVDILTVSNGKLENYESITGITVDQLMTDETSVAVNSLSEAITMQERIARLKLVNLYVFNIWDKTSSNWVEKLAHKTGLTIQKTTSEVVSIDGKSASSSITPLIKNLSVNRALNATAKKFEFTIKKWLPAVACLLGLLFAGAYNFNDDIKQDIQQQKNSVMALTKNIEKEQKYSAVNSVDYKRQLKDVESILQSGIQVSFNQILSRIYDASQIKNTVIYDLLEVEYPSDIGKKKIKITTVGYIDRGWKAPVIAFDDLTSSLIKKGFTILDSSIEVVEGGVSFAYELEIATDI